MAVFADVQYCIYADIVGGSEKVKKHADINNIGMVPKTSVKSNYIECPIDSVPLIFWCI